MRKVYLTPQEKESILEYIKHQVKVFLGEPSGTKLAIWMAKNKFWCDAIIDNIITDINRWQKIKEGFENNESEKCAHCGKSLKDMTILDGLHYHPRGSYCSKECYDAGCKTKKES